MKVRKGFTLTELLISMAFLSVLILLATSLFVMGSKATNAAGDEFDVQADVRNAVEVTIQSIRSTTTVETVPRNVFTIQHRYDPRFSFIGVEKVAGGERLIQLLAKNPAAAMAPASDPYKNHDLKILAAERNDYSFKFSLDKETVVADPDDDDNLVSFTIDVFINDPGMTGTPVYSLSSKVDARNAMQVNNPTVTDIGALAYQDINAKAIVTEGATISKPANVVLVLDVSGSMVEPRLSNLKAAAKAFCEELTAADNVNVALVPFDSSVHSLENATGLRNLKTEYQKDVPKTVAPAAGKVVEGNGIWASIDSLSLTGCTNHVDGLRRAYHSINNRKNTIGSDAFKNELNYVILFTDGVPNYMPTFANGSWNDPYNPNNPFIGTGTRGRFDLRYITASVNAANVIGYPNAINGANSTTPTLTKYGDYMNFWVQKSKDDFGNCEFYFISLGIGTQEIASANLLARRMFLTLDGTNTVVTATTPIAAALDTKKYQTTPDSSELKSIFTTIAGNIILDNYSHLEGPRYE